MNSETLSDKEFRRFTHQIKLPSVGIEGQEKLRKAKVIVIGAGSKGTTVLQNLATAGIGEIGISDNYIIEEKELPKQNLYGDSDIGKQKAIVARQKLAEINKSVKYDLYNICIDKKNMLDICSGYSVIIDATDNFPVKYLLNDAAIILGKPLVFGNVTSSTGMVSVFNYNKGPSLRCLFPDAPKDNKNAKPENMVSAGIINNITGTIMANETIKIILNIKTPLNGNLLNFNISDYTISFQEINKNQKNLEIKSLL
jgi:molybdopterin/thiamine biosynthesis adenylyltransferase